MEPPLHISPRAKAQLERLLRDGKTPQRLARRAKILLDSHLGVSVTRIAELAGKDRSTVYRWQTRWRDQEPLLAEAEASGADEKDFTEKLLEILSDAPRSGAPPSVQRRADHPDRGSGLRIASR